MRHRCTLKLSIAALLVGALLAGCSPFGGKKPPAASLRSLAVVAEAQANRNSATQLDLLFVYDAGVLPLLPANGAAWFQRRDALMSTLGRAVDVLSLQVPPLYRLESVEMPLRHRRAIRVMAYANYLTPSGQAPIELTKYEHATLTLQADRIDASGT